MSKHESHRFAGLAAALAYGVSSMAITLFNKAVLSVYGFNYPQVLTLLQSIVTICSLWGLRRAGIMSFPDMTMQLAYKVAPLAMIFLFYVIVSLASLGRVNIPMFTALRRTTIVMVMLEEYYLNGTTQSRAILASTVVMVLGAIIAAMKDLTFDPVSYLLLFLTNLATSLYTVFIARVKKQNQLTAHALLFYNTALTLPVLTILALVSGEAAAAMYEFPYWSDNGFLACFFFSCTLAFGMNLAVYLSTALNGATTQSVVGQLKNFAGFILGLVLFDDYIYDPTNFAGLLIGFSGGVAYSIVQMRTSKPAAASNKDKDEGSSAIAQALDHEKSRLLAGDEDKEEA